ncbi:MAG: hypothetical protein JW788_04370 [Candidatus Omnitrophica bacterium]|nr:hypothetical protein [Candidatus Omnitrophota bacterium]
MKNKLIFVLTAFFIFLTGTIFAQENLRANAPAQSSPPQDPSRISLDIKGMDVVDVMKMIASRSGMNIVVGKNVTGRVTLFLKDVDIWDAFEIILLANDLAYDKKGGIINVMTQRDYELLYGQRHQVKTRVKVVTLRYAKAIDLARALTQMKTNIGRIIVDEGSNTMVLIDTEEKLKEMEDFIDSTDLLVQTKIFELNYSQADKISAKVQEAITKGVGSIKIDERTNKIIVTDYPEKLEEISKIIEAFDEKTSQVLIDAQIIEIKPSHKFEAGLDWDYWITKNFRFVTSIPTATAANRLTFGMATDNLSLTGKEQYKGIIDLLRTIGDTKILSSPRIMALNNQEAKILVGTKEPYASQTTVTGEGGTVTTSETINFVDVGIKLHVTPTINKDDFVTMKIRPEISSAAERYTTAKGEQIPIVTTSEAETSVMLKDGVTIIIGGLSKEEKSETRKSIPVFGDIPFLGALFRNKSKEVKKTELVILLTPHIMSGDSAYTELLQIKPKDGAVMKMVGGNIVSENISSDQTSRVNRREFANIIEYRNFIWQKISQIASGYIGEDEVYKGRVHVSFILDSRGQLKEWPKVLASTNNLLDLVALKSVKEASPFPPFPKFIDSQEEAFTVMFSYD